MEHLLKKVMSGGLFRLSLLDDACNKVVNNINVLDESNIWHSRLCHIGPVRWSETWLKLGENTVPAELL